MTPTVGRIVHVYVQSNNVSYQKEYKDGIRGPLAALIAEDITDRSVLSAYIPTLGSCHDISYDEGASLVCSLGFTMGNIWWEWPPRQEG